MAKSEKSLICKVISAIVSYTGLCLMIILALPAAILLFLIYLIKTATDFTLGLIEKMQ